MTREFDIDSVCLGYGFVPSSELARQLGCQHRYNEHGQLIVERSDSGQTSQENVYVVGEAGGLGGAEVAMLQGQLAAHAIVDSSRHPVVKLEKLLNRHLAFNDHFGRSMNFPEQTFYSLMVKPLSVGARRLKWTPWRNTSPNGVTHLGTLKRLTRIGMGRCQGRYCGPMLAKLVADISGQTPVAHDYFAPQTPLKPIPLAAIAREKPEWGGHERNPLPPAAGTSVKNAELDTDVLIIGAGIVGSATGYFLTDAGVDTMIVDQGEANAQASGANAGSLHVQLLSFDFGPKAVVGGGPAAATLPLQKAAVELWRHIETTLGADFEIAVTGGLMVAENSRGRAFLKAKIALEKQYGIDTELIDQAELRSLAPAVSHKLIAAAFCQNEGKINPLRATLDILDAGQRAGAVFFPQTKVTSISSTKSGFVVESSLGRIRCRRIVNAAGAWAGQIAQMLDIRLPVHGAPLQMLVTEPVAPMISQLIAHADRHLTLKQVANGNILIGGGWSAGYNPKTDSWPLGVQALRVMPGLHGVSYQRCQSFILSRSWAAMNIDVDGAPVIGEVPGTTGFFNAVTSNGYTLGPLVGQITADLLQHKPTAWDLAPFSSDRFDNL